MIYDEDVMTCDECGNHIYVDDDMHLYDEDAGFILCEACAEDDDVVGWFYS